VLQLEHRQTTRLRFAAVLEATPGLALRHLLGHLGARRSTQCRLSCVARDCPLERIAPPSNRGRSVARWLSCAGKHCHVSHGPLPHINASLSYTPWVQASFRGWPPASDSFATYQTDRSRARTLNRLPSTYHTKKAGRERRHRRSGMLERHPHLRPAKPAVGTLILRPIETKIADPLPELMSGSVSSGCCHPMTG
jgi:hypothetical protein